MKYIMDPRVGIFLFGMMFGSLWAMGTCPHKDAEAAAPSITGRYELEPWGPLVDKRIKARAPADNYSEESLGNTFNMFVLSLGGEHPQTVQHNGAALIGEVIRQTEMYNNRWEVE